ncbi:MAG TPA: choice-of-anchor L domain-containing protein, partial [Bacteroidales bacterium]|nr:choice-of-anchor L domain-containing protein [Bacteroidales bacterium]
MMSLLNMKSLSWLCILFVLLVLSAIPAKAQMIVVSGLTPDQMVQQLIGNGVQYSNVTYQGNVNMNGSFANGNSIGLSEGLVLSSGDVALVPNNPSLNAAGIYGLAGDIDLDALSGYNTHDAAVLEFDFIPLGSDLNFQYVFASEEYPEFIDPQDFNDVFGFFLSGPGILGPFSSPSAFPGGSINIALIPSSPVPVSIFNVNCDVNSQYYIPNSMDMGDCDFPFMPKVTDPEFVFDGYTTVFTATYTVVPCSTYHIKLAVADAVDSNYDSGVFLLKNSFSSTPITLTSNYSVASLDTTMV